MKLLTRLWLAWLVMTPLIFAQSLPEDTISISLSKALQEALQNNDQLKTSRSKVMASEAVMGQSIALRMPQLEINFNYSYLDIVPGFRRQVLGNIQNDFFLNVFLKQPVFTGGRLKNNQKATEAQSKAQQQTYAADKLNLKLAVFLTYYQLQSVHNQVLILQGNIRQLKTHQRYARLLVQAGRMSELELDRLAVEIATIEGKILTLENNYQRISYALSVLMGQDGLSLFVPADSLMIEALPIDSTRIIETAFANNPLWEKYRWDILQGEARVKAQKAARFPQISLSAWYGYEFGTESFGLDRNDRYFVGITTQMPLFDSGLIRSRVDEAGAKLDQSKWQLAHFRKSLISQLEGLFLKIQETEAQIQIQQQALQQARKSYRLALIEYHAGRRSNTDLLDIQKSLINTRLNLNDAIVNYNRSRAELLYAMGIL